MNIETCTSIKFPIYYLFDHEINNKIGSSNKKENILDSRSGLTTFFH